MTLGGARPPPRRTCAAHSSRLPVIHTKKYVDQWHQICDAISDQLLIANKHGLDLNLVVRESVRRTNVQVDLKGLPLP